MRTDGRTNAIQMIILGLLAIIIQAFFIPLIEIGVWRPDIVLLEHFRPHFESRWSHHGERSFGAG